MPNIARSHYAAIYLLQRSLTHKIRTPLSTISNELQYLTSQIGASETERALRKVDEIDKLLAKIATILNIPSESFTLKEFIELMNQNGIELRGIDLPDNTIIPTSFRMLPNLIADLRIKLEMQNNSAIFDQRSSDYFRISLEDFFTNLVQEPMTLCQYFTIHFSKLDAIEPTLIEALMDAGSGEALVMDRNLVLKWKR